MTTTVLSICIPTYKRASCLAECLESILSAIHIAGLDIEVVVSDNASSDSTPEVIAIYADKFKNFKAYRHAENIGAERNFHAVAKMARGHYIWVFGDDDKIAPTAIVDVMAQINAGHDLILCNYDAWSKDFSEVKKKSVLPFTKDAVIKQPDEVMKSFGLNLGFISSVILKKELFFKLSFDEYEKYAPYGFAFAYAAYFGLLEAKSFSYLAKPLVLNRTANSGSDYDWYKYFVTGSSLIFNALVRRGYSLAAAQRAKRGVISQYVIHDILVRKRDRKSVQGLFRLMWPHYRTLPLFWLGVVPALLVPGFLVYGSWRLMRILKRFKTRPVLS
jgi:abequosyltransferase